MIFESHYWKDDLLKVAKRLSIKIKQTRWTEVSFALLEKDVFISFYSIRKLIDAKKLTNRTAKQKVNVYYYPNKGKIVHVLNYHNLDRLYDLNNRKSTSFRLPFICNQLIHSYIFVPVFTTGRRLKSFFFCSDYERNNKLFEIRISSVVNILKSVGTDYPSRYKMEFDESKKDYRMIDI